MKYKKLFRISKKKPNAVAKNLWQSTGGRWILKLPPRLANKMSEALT